MPRGPQHARFVVRFEDEDLLVVEKTSGLLTVPTPKKGEPNLLDQIRDYLGNEDGPGFAFAAHRLDRPVSGLLLFAKSRETLDRLIPQFRDHTVVRRYTAAVAGLIEADKGTYEGWIAENQGSLRVYVADEGEGRRAVTHWKVRERFTATRTTLVDVQLETGLRNQIRLHFAEAGHPLLGERKYLPEGHADRTSVQGKRRIFLHASELEFKHPRNGGTMRFESRLPPQLVSWIERLKTVPKRAPGKKKKDRHRDRKNVGKRRK